MDALLDAPFAIAPAMANALLNSLWQDALLALLALAAFAVLSRRSAALRHLVGMGFLLAMVLAPLLTMATFLKEPATALGAREFVPVVTSPHRDATGGGFVQESSGVASAMALLWMLGAAIRLVRQLGGLRLIGALDRLPHAELPPAWQRRVQSLRRGFGISRAVAVRVSDHVLSPFTVRYLRPVIWLPASLLTGLEPEQIEALLAHELAHIRRADWLWNGLQCVAESLLFFHPAAWWLSRRIRQEREHACDDLAVAACGDAIALAEALATLERRRLPSPHLVLAAHGGSLMQRISRLLSGPPSRLPWRVPVGLVILLCSGGLLAMGIGVSKHKLPNITIHSSTDGALGPGDYREITADGFVTRRYYRISKDSQGRVVELYKENDQVRPIDGGVRDWLSEIAVLTTPPPPPAPPEIAAPPAPPEPPKITDSVAFKELLRAVSTDNRVAALGKPLMVGNDSVSGSMDLDDNDEKSDGQARMSFVLSGPNGQVRVHVSGERHAGAWKLSTLEVGSVSR